MVTQDPHCVYTGLTKIITVKQQKNSHLIFYLKSPGNRKYNFKLNSDEIFPETFYKLITTQQALSLVHSLLLCFAVVVVLKYAPGPVWSPTESLNELTILR